MIVRHTSQMHVEDRPHMRGGAGTVTVKDLLSPEEMFGHGRLFAENVVPPGASVGLHPHEGDTEWYYIVSGRGVYLHDDERHDVVAGDLTVVADGHRHGIENAGDEPLLFIALILYTGGDR